MKCPYADDESLDAPHGPTPCGSDPEDPTRCLCGCDCFYNSCPVNMEWWREEQRKANAARGVG